jgi:hypothetical protein
MSEVAADDYCVHGSMRCTGSTKKRGHRLPWRLSVKSGTFSSRLYTAKDVLLKGRTGGQQLHVRPQIVPRIWKD